MRTDITRCLLAAAVLMMAGTGCATRLSRLDPGESKTYKIKASPKLPGKSNKYLFHIPANWDGKTELPLVVAIHGAFGCAAMLEQSSGWSDLSDRETFLVAYPEGFGFMGYIQHWNVGHCCGRAAWQNMDHVGFVDGIIDEVVRTFPVDTNRIYMTGFSNGGMLTHKFAAERSPRIAAAAVVGGTIGGRAKNEDPMVLPQNPLAPVPMMIVHGTDDPVVPYEGGSRVGKDTERIYLPVSDAIAFWCEPNQCEGESVRRELYDGVVVREDWGHAVGGAPVVKVAVKSWKHQWPGPYWVEKNAEGDVLKGFNASEMIWEFFQGHGLNTR